MMMEKDGGGWRRMDDDGGGWRGWRMMKEFMTKGLAKVFERLKKSIGETMKKKVR